MAMNEIAELAFSLGISDKRLARLAHKMGEDLLPWLKEARAWADDQDRDRYLHMNPGMGKDDYTFEIFRAMRSGEKVNPLERAVPDGYQNVLVMEAHMRYAKHQRSEHAEQRAREDAKRVSAHLRDLVIRAVRVGADPVAVIARVERELRSVEEELQDAA